MKNNRVNNEMKSSQRSATASNPSKSVFERLSGPAARWSTLLLLFILVLDGRKPALASSYLDDFFLPSAKLALNKIQQSFSGVIKQTSPAEVPGTNLVKQKVDNITGVAAGAPTTTAIPETTTVGQRAPEGIDFVRIGPQELDLNHGRFPERNPNQLIADQVVESVGSSNQQIQPQESSNSLASEPLLKQFKTAVNEDVNKYEDFIAKSSSPSITTTTKSTNELEPDTNNADSSRVDKSSEVGGVMSGPEPSVVSVTEASLIDPTTTHISDLVASSPSSSSSPATVVNDNDSSSSSGSSVRETFDTSPEKSQQEQQPDTGKTLDSKEHQAGVSSEPETQSGKDQLQQQQHQEDLSGPPIVVLVGGGSGSGPGASNDDSQQSTMVSPNTAATTTIQPESNSDQVHLEDTGANYINNNAPDVGPEAVLSIATDSTTVQQPLANSGTTSSPANWKEAERDAVAAVDASINFGESPMNNLEDTCYDEYGNARFCEPEFENVAFEQIVEVTSECGSPPTRFCLAAPSHATAGSTTPTSTGLNLNQASQANIRNCHICDANHAKLRHPASHLTDLHSSSAPTCWVSAPQSNRDHSSKSMVSSVRGADSNEENNDEDFIEDQIETNDQLAGDSRMFMRKDNVSLVLNLNKKYEISYVSMQFCSLKPDSLAIYKSDDYGRSWQPYQFYSSHCQRLYGNQLASSANSGSFNATCSSLNNNSNPNSSSANQYAASNQRVSFSTLANHHQLQSHKLQAQSPPPTDSGATSINSRYINYISDWQTATNIKIVLDRPQMGDQLAAVRLASPSTVIQQSPTSQSNSNNGKNQPLVVSPSSAGTSAPQSSSPTSNSSSVTQQLNSGGDLTKPSDSYNYAIADLSVGARCKCNGHASQCVLSGGSSSSGERRSLECDCRHNTAGAECERCAPFHFDRPWSRATTLDANPCQQCKCNGHSRKCYFDAELYRLSGKRSGGVCLSCQDNTTGRHCNYCLEGFARDQSKPISDKEACKPCDCHPLGSLGRACNQTTGQCPCREGVIGLQCNRCAPGYQQSNSANEPCIKIPEKEASYESSITVIDIQDEQDGQQAEYPQTSSTSSSQSSPVDSNQDGSDQMKLPPGPQYDGSQQQPIGILDGNSISAAPSGDGIENSVYKTNQPDDFYSQQDNVDDPEIQLKSTQHIGSNYGRARWPRPELGPYSRGASKRRKGPTGGEYPSGQYYNSYQSQQTSSSSIKYPANNNIKPGDSLASPVQGDPVGTASSPDYQDYPSQGQIVSNQARYYNNHNTLNSNNNNGHPHSKHHHHNHQHQYPPMAGRRHYSMNSGSNKGPVVHTNGGGLHHNQRSNHRYEPAPIEHHAIMSNVDQEVNYSDSMNGGAPVLDDNELGTDEANFNRISLDNTRRVQANSPLNNNHRMSINNINNKKQQQMIQNGRSSPSNTQLNRQQAYQPSMMESPVSGLTGNELPIVQQQAGSCGECRESRRRGLTRAHFCHLDYALKAIIRSRIMSDDWTRFEVKILDIYKSPPPSALPLLGSLSTSMGNNQNSNNNKTISETSNNGQAKLASLEHRLKVNSVHWIWVPTEDLSCKCLRLRSGFTYLILGSVDSGGDLLQLDRHGLALEWQSSFQDRLRKHQRRLARGKCHPGDYPK